MPLISYENVTSSISLLFFIGRVRYTSCAPSHSKRVTKKVKIQLYTFSLFFRVFIFSAARYCIARNSFSTLRPRLLATYCSSLYTLQNCIYTHLSMDVFTIHIYVCAYIHDHVCLYRSKDVCMSAERSNFNHVCRSVYQKMLIFKGQQNYSSYLIQYWKLK